MIEFTGIEINASEMIEFTVNKNTKRLKRLKRLKHVYVTSEKRSETYM